MRAERRPPPGGERAPSEVGDLRCCITTSTSPDEDREVEATAQRLSVQGEPFAVYTSSGAAVPLDASQDCTTGSEAAAAGRT